MVDAGYEKEKDGNVPKSRFRTKSKKLEAVVNRYKSEATALQADIDTASEIEAQTNNLEQVISEIPDLLPLADNDEQLKLKILERLSFSAYMFPDKNNKHVDWALFAPVTCRSEPQARLSFGSGFEPAPS